MKDWIVIGMCAMAAVTARGAEEKVSLDGRRETFTNTVGRVFTNVFLLHQDKLGLTWGATSNTPMGMVKWAAIPEAEMERLQLTWRWKIEAQLKANREAYAATESWEAAVAAARLAHQEKTEKIIEKELLTIFPTISWRGAQVTASVSTGFYLLPFDEKKRATALLLGYVQGKEPQARFVELKDEYSGKSVGKMGIFGFSMK